ncbi:alpha-hydroxy acid oxidase [Bradyrhizobium sp. USDA 10063]
MQQLPSRILLQREMNASISSFDQDQGGQQSGAHSSGLCGLGRNMMDFLRRDLLSAGAAAATMTAATAVFAQTNSPVPTEAPQAQPGMTGTLPNNEKRLRIINLRDLESEAQKVMTPYGFAYVAGGAGDEWTMRENLAAFNRTVIVPNYLLGNKTPDTGTELLGAKLPFPIIAAPVGFQGSMHAQKELPTVKGAGLAGTLYVASSVTQLSLEEIAAATPGDKWFQPYIPASRPFAIEMLQRAKASGYKAIVLTIDATVTSNRERSTRLVGVPVPNLALGNVPKTPGVSGNAMAMKVDLSWDDIEFCRSHTGLPVIVKGILSAAQAAECERYGCAAVWLSNHGGRQLDNTPSAMTVLPRVADALKGRLPIIIDGGIYRGQDVFRAIALGASAVALGRPLLYGSALGGAAGVQSVYEHLRNELIMTMQLAGTPNIKSVVSGCVARAEV